MKLFSKHNNLPTQMRTFVAILAFLIAVIGSAQTLTLSGTVVDSLSREPQAFATLRIFSETNTQEPLKMFLTDINGAFSEEVEAAGDLRLVASALGKKSTTLRLSAPMNAGKSRIDLGTVALMPVASEADAATVTASKPVVRVETDKITYDLEADPDTKTLTLLDALRRVPLVTVDGQDNIMVNGSSSFKVYVDGKPSPMFSQNTSQVLKSIPASYARDIEVITNPGARYDAEGAGGIINIKTQASGGGRGGAAAASDDLQGYTANVHTQYSSRDGMGANGFVTVQKNRLTLSLGMSYNVDTGNEVNMTYDREQRTDAETFLTNIASKGSSDVHFTNGNFSLSYKIDSLRLFTASGSLMRFTNRSSSAMNTSMQLGAIPLSSYTQLSDGRNRYSNAEAKVDYQRSFAGNPDRFLTLSYQFASSGSRNKQFNRFSDIYNAMLDLGNRFSDDDMSSTEHTGQIDYTTPIVKNHQLSVGAKYIGRRNASQSAYYSLADAGLTPSPDDNTDYKFYNDIAAAYAEYEGSFDKLKLKAGARYEHTFQRVRYKETPVRNFSLDYGNLVPSASLSYNFTPTRSVGLSYAMRITRPNIYSLNPYVDRNNPTSISYGNSTLDAEKVNSLTASFNSFSGKWVLSLRSSLSFCRNGIEQYSFFDDEHVLNTTYGNVKKATETGANAFLTFKPSAKTSLTANFGGSYADLRSKQLGRKRGGWHGNLMLGAQHTLPWQLKLSLNVMAMSKHQTLQGTMGGFSGMFGSLSRDFFKGVLSASLSGFTPLTGTSINFKMRTSGSDFVNRMHVRVPVAQVAASLTLHLGKMGIATQRVRRSIENNDVNENGRQSTEQGATENMQGGMGM